MTVDPQVQALRELLRADHEAWIAEVQQWADEAGAAGDLERPRRHLAHVQGGAQSHFGCSCGVLRVGVQAQEGQE